MEGTDGGDFHRNEAISAVADDGFLAEEEEDEDYEDLYNDVNVGEGFYQSLSVKNEAPDVSYQTDAVEASRDEGKDAGATRIKLEETSSAFPEVLVTSGASQVSIPVQTSVNRVSGYENQGFKGPSNTLSSGSGGIRVELGQSSLKVNELDNQHANLSSNIINNNNVLVHQEQQKQHFASNVAPMEHVGSGVNENMSRNMNGAIGGVGNSVNNAGGEGGGGGTILFVGDLHWWTTDAELESELVNYGPVKEVMFFYEKASGKSKGYCQVEFYDPAAATACKEGMNNHKFNGRPCVVAFASPYTVKRMGEAQVNRTQQPGQQPFSQGRKGPNDAVGKSPANPGAGVNNMAVGGNYQGGEGGRGYGRGNWGRGNGQGMGSRGPGPMRNRPSGMGGRGLMGNGFGQGMGGPPQMMHPQSMMGQGFDPFGGPMARMGGYGGFPGATPPFSGVMSSFPAVGGMGFPGVAPHVNPAFFGRGMPMNGMGMMPATGVDGTNMGMWSDPSMGGWGGEEHGAGRAGESSYGEEAASDHQYNEVTHERAGWQNPRKERDVSSSADKKYRDDRDGGYEREMPKEKDMGSHEQDWPERKPRDDRDIGRERDRDREVERERPRDRDKERERYRDDRDVYADHHRYRDQDVDHDDQWDRGRQSRSHGKSQHGEEHRSRSRDADYGKRRRLTSD